MRYKFKGAENVLPYQEQKVLLRNNGKIEQYIVTKGRDWLVECDKDFNMIKGAPWIEDPYTIVRKIETETECI